MTRSMLHGVSVSLEIAPTRMARTVSQAAALWGWVALLILGAHSTAIGQSSCYVYVNGGEPQSYYPTAPQACAASSYSYVYPQGEGTFYETYTLGPLLDGSPATNNAIYQCNGTAILVPTTPADCNEFPAGSCNLNPADAIHVSEIAYNPGSTCPSFFVGGPPQQPEVCGLDCINDPVNPAVGNVYTTETDFSFAKPSPIKFQRFYNSADTYGMDGVAGWRHSYDRFVATIYQNPALYPPPPPYSSEYSTPQAACVSGFSSIQGQVSGWAGATATYGGGVCILTNTSGVQIATLPIYSYPIGVQPSQPIEYDLYRDDGQILRFTIQG